MKKTIGIIMVVFGTLVAIGMVAGLPRTLSHLGDVTAEQGWGSYVFGYIGGQMLAVVVAYLLITFGLRLSKGKKELSKNS
jgi:hypothetical protein